jgi:hypothetical protein
MPLALSFLAAALAVVVRSTWCSAFPACNLANHRAWHAFCFQLRRTPAMAQRIRFALELPVFFVSPSAIVLLRSISKATVKFRREHHTKLIIRASFVMLFNEQFDNPILP